MRTRTVLVAMVFVLACLARGAVADESLYQQGLRAVAWIVAGDISGSGVLVDADQRLVITNYHVVGDAETVKVCFPAQRDGDLQVERAYYQQHLEELALPGRVTVTDPRRDLAVVQLESLPESALAARLAPSSPAPGDAVHSIGNPGSSDALWVYTSGTVRQVYEAKMRMPNGVPLRARIIETQAPINPGDSGGPAFGDTGELVGIVQSFQLNAQLVSRCIDVSEVRDMLEGHSKTWDQRVSQALNAEDLKYTTNPYGLFRLAFRDEEEEENDTLVFVDSDTTQVGKSEIREVKALVFTSDRPLTTTLANDLLRRNFQYSLGAWSIAEDAGTRRLFFVARIDANASSQQLRDAIGHVLAVVNGEADLLVQLNAAQAVDASALVGTWVGEAKTKTGEKVRWQVDFLANGAFSFDDETRLTRGRYRLVDGVIQLDIRGESKSLGPVRLPSPDQLLLDLGWGDITFTRNSAAATLAADSQPEAAEDTPQALAGTESRQGG